MGVSPIGSLPFKHSHFPLNHDYGRKSRCYSHFSDLQTTSLQQVHEWNSGPALLHASQRVGAPRQSNIRTEVQQDTQSTKKKRDSWYYCWWFRNPKANHHLGMVWIKPCEKWGIFNSTKTQKGSKSTVPSVSWFFGLYVDTGHPYSGNTLNSYLSDFSFQECD